MLATHICKENIQSAFFAECLLANAGDCSVVRGIGLDYRSLRGSLHVLSEVEAAHTLSHLDIGPR